jgi:hypothetical protein
MDSTATASASHKLTLKQFSSMTTALCQFAAIINNSSHQVVHTQRYEIAFLHVQTQKSANAIM